MSLSKRRGKNSGNILLLSIFFLIILLSLSIAFFRIIPAEFHSANASRQTIQANYAADSGGHHAVAWLKHEMATSGTFVVPDSKIISYNTMNFGSHSGSYTNDWPNGSSVSSILSRADHKVDSDWSFLSRIRMDDSDFFRRIYTIESCAYFKGKPKRVARLTVQNESFADFALYISDWNPSNIYTMGPNGIQGPVHTNGHLRLAAPHKNFWTAKKADGSEQDPWVSGPLARITQSGTFRVDSTTPANTLGISGDGVQYANGNSFQSNWDLVPFDGSGTPISERYNKIVENGRDNIKQVSEIYMPEQNEELRQQAWGDKNIPKNASQFTSKTKDGDRKIMVNTTSGLANDPAGKVNGGIFISGSDVQDLLMDITPEGHQKIKLQQGNISVGSGTGHYRYQEERYRKQVTIPGTPWHRDDCVAWVTKTRDRYEDRSKQVSVTRQNGDRCGYTETFIPGDNGTSTTVRVANTCTYLETQWERVKVGTEQYQECTKTERVTGTNPPTTQWQETHSEDPDRQVYYVDKTSQTQPEGVPSTFVEGTISVPNWTSVVEVNEDVGYQIPFYNGVKVNGEAITESTDPRLTVADGHTVKIQKDFVVNGKGFAEYTVMEGRTNGVVYSDVNLWNVRGTNKGSKYPDENGDLKYQGRVLAANVGTGKDLEIQDSILQYYGVQDDLNDGRNRVKAGESSPNADHIFGLVARNIWIDTRRNSKEFVESNSSFRETDFNGGHFKGGLNVYGIIMAGKMQDNNEVGGFKGRDSIWEWNDGLGDFNLFGGIITAESGNTQKTDSNNPRGFRLNLNYDRVAAEALRYLPSTNIFSALRYVTFPPG